MRTSWPRTEDLAFEPELAPLALLEAAFAIAVQALIARNPEMLVDDEALKKTPRVAAALHIVVLYRELADELDTYRALLPPVHDGTDDIPF
jgi:hypothetical protein